MDCRRWPRRELRRSPSHRLMCCAALFLLGLFVSTLLEGQHVALGQGLAQGDPQAATTLDCHVRKYTHKVVKTDKTGRSCWDYVGVVACWGRCDSREISDWRFPNKKAFHPVCLHAVRAPSVVTLRHCEPSVEPGTERHELLHALSCRCAVCRSNEASCESARMRSPSARSSSALPAPALPVLQQAIR